MIVVYALLTLAGAGLPWYYNLQFMALTGSFDLGAFLSGVFANPASSSIGVDILVGATAFQVWMVTEACKLGMKHWWVYIVFTIAFAFACPLFLLMRERHLRAQHA
jgi:predicted permease